jgi:hypothetical protein
MGLDALDEGGQGDADFGEVGGGAEGKGGFLVLALLGVGAHYHGYGLEVGVGLEGRKDGYAVKGGQDEVKEDECQVSPWSGKEPGALDETVSERMRGLKLPCLRSLGSSLQGCGSDKPNCGYPWLDCHIRIHPPPNDDQDRCGRQQDTRIRSHAENTRPPNYHQGP